MYKIFEKLCIEHNVTQSQVAKDTGIKQPILSNWKAGRHTPNNDKLKIIAEYFDVTIDYLLTGDEKVKEKSYKKNTTITLDQIHSIKYDNLSKNQQDRMKEIFQMLIDCFDEKS